MSIYAAIEERTSEIIAGAVQEIRAARMPAEISLAIGTPSDDSSLIICRRCLAGTASFCCAPSIGTAERFSYIVRIGAARSTRYESREIIGA